MPGAPSPSATVPSMLAPTDTDEGRLRRKRLGKKEKLRLNHNVEPAAATRVPPVDDTPVVVNFAQEVVAPYAGWSWMPLVDATPITLPVVFSQDQKYSFVPVGSTVKIYSVATVQLLSTLCIPRATEPSSNGSIRRTRVSCCLVNPSNPLQLLVGSLDGMLRIWDFKEGKLIRTLDLGSPLLHACGHARFPDQLFVALQSLEQGEGAEQPSLAGIYSISLKAKALAPASATTPMTPLPTPTTPRAPARRMRLAKPRLITTLAISPAGAFLVAVSPHQINLCNLAQLHKGFSVSHESNEVLTCLAFHPVENYLATGNGLGQIRLWYGILEDGAAWETAVGVQKRKLAALAAGSAAPRLAATQLATLSSTAVLHWHAHPVASLTFTPNGAYLMSGGEEAVLVLWQLHTGHKEFVPRLGSPIVTLSINSHPDLEQQVAARLRDGSVVFVGSQKLKINKTISGIRADPVRSSSSSQQHLPLAVQPASRDLVLPSSHPSSLQFYSLAHDTQTLELEVSPSNRVSAVGSREIEPTRIELVAFSSPSATAGGAYWMATLDTWVNGTFAVERHLKFWRYSVTGQSFELVTRIDAPHDDAITSMSFSPSSESSLCLTTGLDGTIKVWGYSGDSWRCRSALSYRSWTPLDAAWSEDGSMFSVAHPECVTLWSLAANALIKSFPCQGIAPVRQVEFVGPEGTLLLVGGQHGTRLFDLLTFEESLSVNMSLQSLTPQPHSSVIVATEKSMRRATHSSSHLVIDAHSRALVPQQLPFAIRQSLWLASPHATARDNVSLVVVNGAGEVLLVGEGLGSAGEQAQGVVTARLPQTSTGQSRLFDDMFGTAATASKPRASGSKAARVGKTFTNTSLAVLDAPAHTLPPAHMLWRTMLGSFQITQAVSDGDAVAVVEEADVEMVDATALAGPGVTYAVGDEESLALLFAHQLRVNNTVPR